MSFRVTREGFKKRFQSIFGLTKVIRMFAIKNQAKQKVYEDTLHTIVIKGRHSDTRIPSTQV